MEKSTAIKFIDTLVTERGTKEAINILAQAAKVKWHTAYGWWRRGSVPEWRLEAIQAIAARPHQTKKKRA
jgi:hypothetical protein